MAEARATSDFQNRTPARVFGCLKDGELRIVLCPGNGLADGGIPRDVPIANVPP